MNSAIAECCASNTTELPAAIGPLALVNSRHPILRTASIALIPPDAAHPDVLMEAQAARMLAACLRAVGGVGRIVPVSGWRSRAEQQQIWDDTMAKEGETFTRQYVAGPGCSEHETGLAIDLAAAAEDIDFIRPDFPYDGVCGEFRKAAALYGFIERYRADKTEQTGIAAEPWHFRYVGAPHALYMERHGLCLEEYIALLSHHSLICRMKDGQIVKIRRFACGQPLPPAEGLRQISDDNAGGVVVSDWGDRL